MGHSNPDIDAMGSALGVYRIAKTLRKEAYIVANKETASIRTFVECLPEEYNEVLINKQNNIISIPNILDEKKIRKDSVIHERKATEEVNIQTNYFDMSKKHTKKKISIDMSRILNEIIVENNEIHLGKKLKREDKNELSYLSATNIPSASLNK